jgi:hypothetical protein
MRAALRLRDVTDEDGPALVALIGAAYDEFACGPMDPGGFDADLASPATHAARRSRRWWVVTDRRRDTVLVASVRHTPLVATSADARRAAAALPRAQAAASDSATPSSRG